MQDQPGPVGMFGDSLAHFHAASRSLVTHWYHVSLKRRHEDRFVAYEEMLSDEPRLVELLVSQNENVLVQEVQVVTPGWMNKGLAGGWRSWPCSQWDSSGRSANLRLEGREW